MTYEEALEFTLTAAQVKRFIEEHCHNFEDFKYCSGHKAIYTGKEVLDWLGY